MILQSNSKRLVWAAGKAKTAISQLLICSSPLYPQVGLKYQTMRQKKITVGGEGRAGGPTGL